MKPVIITGNENAEHNAKYPLNACKRMLLLRRTAQTNTLSCRTKPIAFEVNGQTVIVDSEKLAKALLCLSERRREIIFMRYYLQLRDRQIAALLGKRAQRSTIRKMQLWSSCGQKWRRWMMKNSKYNLVPYEVIGLKEQLQAIPPHFLRYRNGTKPT